LSVQTFLNDTQVLLYYIDLHIPKINQQIKNVIAYDRTDIFNSFAHAISTEPPPKDGDAIFFIPPGNNDTIFTNR
jgi:hypothetical protein